MEPCADASRWDDRPVAEGDPEASAATASLSLLAEAPVPSVDAATATLPGRRERPRLAVVVEVQPCARTIAIAMQPQTRRVIQSD